MRASPPRVVTQNVANLYARPDTSSELVSQAILGETVIVEQEENECCFIATPDRYQGWIARQHLALPADDSDSLATTIATLFADIYREPEARSEMLTKLVVGTRVTLAHRAGTGEWVPLQLPGGQLGYVHRISLNLSHAGSPENLSLALGSGLRREDVLTAVGRQVADTARRFVGTPYLWGGCTPFGLDCSGLTQLAYKLNGVPLLRDAHLQFADRRFGRVEEEQSLETALLEEGDLVVFSRRADQRPTHIGLALGDGRFVHARGGMGVRIDFCDDPEYLATYLGAVRLSPDADLAIQAA